MFPSPDTLYPKKRFSDDIIECLEKIQWWNWDINKIVENTDVIIGKDVDKLKKLSEGI